MLDDDELTEEEQEDLEEGVEELRALDEVQTLYERIAFLGTPKMPCPECGGAGSVYGGSLGDMCPGCNGARMVDHPAAEEIAMPDFAGMRRALLDHSPDAPTLADIRALQRKGKEFAGGLPTTPALPQLQPPAPSRTVGSLGGGALDISDDEVDALLDAEEDLD